MVAPLTYFSILKKQFSESLILNLFVGFKLQVPMRFMMITKTTCRGYQRFSTLCATEIISINAECIKAQCSFLVVPFQWRFCSNTASSWLWKHCGNFMEKCLKHRLLICVNALLLRSTVASQAPTCNHLYWSITWMQQVSSKYFGML